MNAARVLEAPRGPTGICSLHDGYLGYRPDAPGGHERWSEDTASAGYARKATLVSYHQMGSCRIGTIRKLPGELVERVDTWSVHCSSPTPRASRPLPASTRCSPSTASRIAPLRRSSNAWADPDLRAFLKRFFLTLVVATIALVRDDRGGDRACS